MTVLPWIVTGLVVIGCAFCLTLFGSQLDETRDQLAQARADVGDIKTWIAENFGGPQPVALADTEPMARIEVAGGARMRPSPRPRTDVDLSRFSFDPEGRRAVSRTAEQ